MYETTTEETEMLQLAGYIPAWVEDITEGMEVCYMDRLTLREIRSKGLEYPQPEFLRFATVTDLRKDSSVEHDEYGKAINTHVLVRCFMLDDEGRFFEFARGAGHHIWVKVPAQDGE